MNCWFLFIAHVISTCTATKILYVLPDNVSDVNCPSQPCATLGQYLLDNGSLPVLSDVEYHFLPGDHHVVNIINMYDAFNFSLIGFGLSPAKLICTSHYYVGVFNSYNVTIRNLVFSQCSGDLESQFPLYIAAGLFLIRCSYCQVEDLKFFGYGFVGVNLLLNSYLNNITIDITTVRRTVFMCSQKFYLIFVKVEDDYDYIVINQVVITGHTKLCYKGHKSMEIELYKSYGVHVELWNSHFYNTTQVALYIRMEYTNGSLLVNNCTFRNIIHNMELLYYTVNSEISANNVTVKFENCAFYHNVALHLLAFNFAFHHGFRVHPSNVTIENCDFIGNIVDELIGVLVVIPNYKANIFFNDVINFAENKAYILMRFTRMTVIMNGTITVLKNNVTESITVFESCEITFTKTITYLSNICDTVVYISYGIRYIRIMEYANILFINNTYHHLFVSSLEARSYVNVFPDCIFQYMALAKNKFNISRLLTLYTINVSGNQQVKEASIFSSTIQLNDVYDFLTHCEWLQTAVFNGYSPGYINQQIIQVDGNKWIHRKKICYCPHDEDNDCTVDLLGPTYPGQKLQVYLCIPNAESEVDYILYAETHSTSLPSSACKIAHQTEFVSIIRNHPKLFNFTIISESNLCQLFFTVQPFVRGAFYVQLLPCPVGFTLQNGMCDCDPFLPPDIDTCYIDLSAIRRPANTWITAHTLTNNTISYFISHCSMDYCLPYSTNVNLVHPDLQCQFNRTGILCSQCPHTLSMVLGSSRCMKCTNVHILITIIVIVAGIVLVVLLYVLNLTVTNGTINGIIFYANIVSINDSVFLVNDNVFKPLRVFLSFTNLDLGIETCFYNGMDSYVKMWLQLFFPSYLMIIAVSIIIASRYSSRILRLTYSRSLPVLATLFLLSYTGVLRVILTVLFSYSTITHYPSGDKQIVWSIDASVPLFGLKFTILFITCLVLLLILIPFSIALLFTRYLSRFRLINRFKPLLDAFQGSYKDKYSYWVAVNIIVRCIIFSLYSFQTRINVFLVTIILVVFTACYGYLCPNKNKGVNIHNLLLLINLTILYAVPLLNNDKIFRVVTNFLISLTFMQLCITFLYHFLTYTFHCNVIIKEKLIKIFPIKRISNHLSCDVPLLVNPECRYNYNEYRDELVSDDFK